MARIIFPEGFFEQSELFIALKQKNTDDGMASPLLTFLAQQNIDLAADEVVRLAAVDCEKARVKKGARSEDFREKRDLLFVPVMKHLRGYYQFLKKFYSPNIATVGTWGVPITVAGRIVYPPEFVNRKAIVAALEEKYNSYPAGTSPLEPYLVQQELTIAADVANTNDASGFNDQFTQLAKESEEATSDRNLIWNPVVKHIHQIGTFLMALFNNNPKQLGYWGLTVDDSRRAPKVIISKLKLLSQITATNLTIGGTFKNLGTVPLTIYKGKTLTPAGIVVLPGGTFGIAKGFSTITVVNSSSVTTGIFSALRAR